MRSAATFHLVRLAFLLSLTCFHATLHAAIQFAAPVSYNVGTNCAQLATGDFNADGKLDLFAASGFGTNRVWVLMNNGSGAFTVFTNYTVAGSPQWVVTGDFNNDTKLDAITLNYSGDTIGFYRGNGDGTFTVSSSSYTLNYGSPSAAVGDFNNDGKLDLALGTYYVRILYGQGNGTFSATNPTYLQGTYYQVATGDFNTDGIPDLVTANYSASSMSVLIGVGNGTFTGITNYSGDFSEYHYSVAVDDFNKDTKPDLVTCNFYNHSLSVRLNNGDGTFGTENKFDTVIFGATAIRTADFDRDSNVDLVVGGSSNPALAALPGNGDGTFRTSMTNLFSGTQSGTVRGQSVVVGDFDGDGWPDVASTLGAKNSVTIWRNTSAALPLVKIVSPTNNQVFFSTAPVTIEATASSFTGSITNVEFLRFNVSLTNLPNSPYSATISNWPPATNLISAVATDNFGFKSTNTISIVLNRAPSANLLSPTNGTRMIAPATFTISTLGTDLDGIVTNVQFFLGKTFFDQSLVGSRTTGPYNLTISNLVAGNYWLSIKSTDNLGESRTSSPPVNISVITNALLSMPEFLADSFQFSTAVISNNHYVVEASTNLGDTNGWTVISNFFAPSNGITISDPATTNFNQRFYRVRSD